MRWSHHALQNIRLDAPVPAGAWVPVMGWEITKIVLTASVTILGGVFIYVLGQIATRFFIEPYHEYRKLVGEIADALVYYANVSSSSNVDIKEKASDKFRQQRSLLRVRAEHEVIDDQLLPVAEKVEQAHLPLFAIELV
jgi:hypothetical protein